MLQEHLSSCAKLHTLRLECSPDCSHHVDVFLMDLTQCVPLRVVSLGSGIEFVVKDLYRWQGSLLASGLSTIRFASVTHAGFGAWA